MKVGRAPIFLGPLISIVNIQLVRACSRLHPRTTRPRVRFSFPAERKGVCETRSGPRGSLLNPRRTTRTGGEIAARRRTRRRT